MSRYTLPRPKMNKTYVLLRPINGFNRKEYQIVRDERILLREIHLTRITVPECPSKDLAQVPPSLPALRACLTEKGQSHPCTPMFFSVCTIKEKENSKSHKFEQKSKMSLLFRPLGKAIKAVGLSTSHSSSSPRPCWSWGRAQP